MPNRSRVYVHQILSPCFEVAKRRFYRSIMEVNLAHTLMLNRCAIIPAEAARALTRALLDRMESPPQQGYDPTYEDLFFLIEAQVEQTVGAETAGHLHVAFSRNDLDAAIFRMALRQDLLDLLDRLLAARSAVLTLAGQHAETVMVAHTHNQQAQPTTLAHYLLAVEGNLARDTERLLALYSRVNRSPMGAAALTTTGFPIDRELVARWLGFEGLVENAYDAVSASDHMLEAASALAVMGSNLSRFTTDLLLWATNEFDILRLDDSLVQVSSIMPQKRNPVAIEHLRAVLSRLMGRAGALFPLAHNVPLGDINDVGDDLQPLLEEAVEEARRALDLLPEILAKLSFNTALLEARAREGFSVVTELADTLVREEQIPFRQAHHVVSRFVQVLRSEQRTLPDASLVELNTAAQAVLGRPTGLTEEGFRRAIDPRHFVERRAVVGGPAPREVRRALQAAGGAVEQAKAAVTARREAQNRARSLMLSDALSLLQG
ncbi:MAG: argininosuccinate lyase [Bacillota bacterium]